MPVNYNAFYVDPSQARQQSMANIANSANFLANQRQREIGNALTRESLDYQKQRDSLSDEQNKSDREIKLTQIQASTVYKALSTVKDPQSWQTYKTMLQQIGQTPLGQTRFWNQIIKDTPDQYNPALVEQGKQILGSIIEREKNSGFTLGEGQIRFTSTGEEIARGPKKTNRGEAQLSDFTDEEIAMLGANYNLTGKMPSVGRGNTPLRNAILKSATRQSIEAGRGAGDVIGAQADVKALSGSIAQQEKQLGSMGSFVRNLSAQVDKVKELSNDLKTFDTRLLNVPLRKLRGRWKGSPEQAKYDMYLTEIESEIGKLATGSTGSVAELSQGAQEKWERIHDKNLSINDMLKLLEETKNAGNIRMKSVKDQLGETRGRLRDINKTDKSGAPQKKKVPKEAVDYLMSHPELKNDFKAKYGYLPEGL